MSCIEIRVIFTSKYINMTLLNAIQEVRTRASHIFQYKTMEKPTKTQDNLTFLI